MSSSSVPDSVYSILNRLNECSASDSGEYGESYDVKLAFALTGLDRSDLFSPFFPLHRLIASKLIDYFISIEKLSDFEKVAHYGREKINPNLFSYAFSVAALNRPDMQNVLLLLPNPAEMFPDKFLSATTMLNAITELNTVPADLREPIKVEAIESDTYPEARLEYFRHDLGLNVGYYFWLVTHQFEAVRNEIVDLDRRGELWCYFHQQIIARYDAERHCNGLLHVSPLTSLDEPMPEGNFPKLITQNATRSWSPRFDNTRLDDLYRPYEGLVINKDQFQRWIDRVCNAIELGEVRDEQGNKIPLNNEKGIDILGNLLQSSKLSVNRKFYGDIAHMGHALIAYCHDPENQSYQSYGVMGEPATCMTDLLFYRWYARVLQIVKLHKRQLPPYTEEELKFDGIKITSLHVEDTEGSSKDRLQTYWGHANFNLKNGLSNQPNGDVHVQFKHLQHKDFRYVIDVENTSLQAETGMVRIFLAQKNNTRGRQLIFEEQRTLWFELDRFSYEFQPGVNNIVRNSTDSSVTIASANYFQPEAMREKMKESTANNSAYCLTGWPAHLLIPKGTLEGAEFLLFAMVSKDAKMTDEQIITSSESVYAKCTKAFSYCGLLKSKYPDKRNMGFPFDRPASIETLTMDNFLLANMKTQEVIIQFAGTPASP